tara:strand:- start:1598 stop:2533 length:936 start_codon:yes stop_codon:yes gene_type:complete
MLLEKLINPKPRTTLIFVVLSVVFLALPFVLNASFYIKNENSYILLYSIISILIIVLHAFGLNNLIYKNDVIKKENLIVATVFVLLNTFNYSANLNIISSFLLLFFINYLLESYQKEFPFHEVFCCSFLLSVIMVFNPIVALMYIVFLACSIIFNFNNWRSYFVSILGLIMPYLITIMLLSIIDSDINILSFYSLPEFSSNYIELLDFYQANKNILILFALIALISFVEFFNWLYKKSIRSRKSFFIILIYFIITSIIALFGSTSNWYVLLSPISVFIANYFTYTKKRNLANILFCLFIIASLFYRSKIMI